MQIEKPPLNGHEENLRDVGEGAAGPGGWGGGGGGGAG